MNKLKIKFFVKNKEDTQFTLDKIKISQNNPRFTILESSEEGYLFKKIKDNFCPEQDTFNLLIKNEGILSDYLTLLKNINKFGFKNKSEEIYVINNQVDYLVAEGNRRISCLKLLNGDLVFPEYKEIKNNVEYNTDLDRDDIEKSENTILNNYKSILQIIENFDRNNEIKVYLNVLENDEDIWSMIYSKHVTGERTGMRNWSRGKYFLDLLSLFKNGINEKNKDNEDYVKFESICFKMQRDPSKIIVDFREAQFVYEIYKATYYTTPEDIKLYMCIEKVSALQSNFSLSKIKSCAKENLHIDKKEFKTYFNYDFGDDNIIILYEESNEQRIEYKVFLNFIYIQFKKGVITTRPISPEKIDEFNSDVRILLLFPNIGNKVLSKEEFYEINPLTLDIKYLENILYVNEKNIEDDIKKYYENVISIKNMHRDISKNLYQKNSESTNMASSVFSILINQYEHNAKKDFLNAMGTSIRSFFEQFLCYAFTLYSKLDIFSDDITPGATRDGWSNFPIGDKELRFEFCVDKISTGEINCMKSYVINHMKQKISKQHYELAWKELLSTILNDSISDNEIKEICSYFNNSYQDHQKSLNEFVHATHRVYKQNNYFQIIENINNSLTISLKILKNLNFIEIKNIDEKIINCISDLKKSLT